MRIPRKASAVVEPSVLLAATGMPRKCKVSRAVERVSLLLKEFGQLEIENHLGSGEGSILYHVILAPMR